MAYLTRLRPYGAVAKGGGGELAVQKLDHRRRGPPYPHTYVGRVGVGTTNKASPRPLLRRVGLASRIKLRKRVFFGGGVGISPRDPSAKGSLAPFFLVTHVLRGPYG